MKKLIVAATLVGLVAVVSGADKAPPAKNRKNPPDKENPAASLKVGDLAPALKATKWLQGGEVKAFEPGKVYVVEFWATWCAPCIYFMPHLAELQAQYKDKGVIVIGYSARDPINTQDKVVAFVDKRGSKLPYPLAYGDDRTTYDAWMTAAGRTGIPCSFVVEKTGRIAYIGYPMYLGVVLPKVIAGKLTAKEVGDEAGKIEQELDAIGAALFPDNKAGLKALQEFEAKYPALANNLYSIRIKLSLLPKVGEVAEAKKVAEKVIAHAIKQDNPSVLGQVAALLRNGPGKESRELLGVAVKAAEAAVRLESDARALLDVAETYFAFGDKAKAAEFARKAVLAAAGESTELKQDIDKQAKAITDGKKEDKK